MKNRILTSKAIIITIVTVFVVLIFGLYFGSAVIDIQLHDTYFVIETWLLVLLGLLSALFVISLSATVALRFREQNLNWFSILRGLSLVVYFSYLYSVLSI